MPAIIVEKKKYRLVQNRIFPLNPDQTHLYTKEKLVETYMAIFIKTEYMKEYSHLLTGKSKLFFDNGSSKNMDTNKQTTISIHGRG